MIREPTRARGSIAGTEPASFEREEDISRPACPSAAGIPPGAADARGGSVFGSAALRAGSTPTRNRTALNASGGRSSTWARNRTRWWLMYSAQSARLKPGAIGALEAEAGQQIVEPRHRNRFLGGGGWTNPERTPTEFVHELDPKRSRLGGG